MKPIQDMTVPELVEAVESGRIPSRTFTSFAGYKAYVDGPDD